MKYASNLRREIDVIQDCLDGIDKVVDRKAREAFRGLRDRLDGWAARVAVIGQVKAGKSTFLNAFLGQHDFLPSDVNPWTSVVTNLRINVDKDPSAGASFEFFDEKDWQEITDGRTPTRQLAEQVLPGFDAALLREQSEELRQRAQRRLGKHYHSLLGGRHDYDFLSPDLLKRYVCAGPGSDDGLEREALGRYAALTKVANIYLRLPDFLVPTIITDTPGVNDPFLVRDEFTCRSLDKSEVFVVVLSAHQPLTDVDIALIRILAKQDSKDVLVFVNRIDELDDYSREVPRVLEDVSRRLQAALPDVAIPVVAGSAYLADLAIRADDAAAEARKAADTAELAAYLRMRTGHVPASLSDRLLAASGLDDIKTTLSDVIDNGVAAHQLVHLVSDIRAELTGIQFATRRERDGLLMQIESIRSDVAEEALANLEAELVALRAVQAKLEEHYAAAEGQIEKLLHKYWSSLESRLMEKIESFVTEQRPMIEGQVLRVEMAGATEKSVEIDILPMQIAFEHEVSKGYEKARATIDTVLSNCIHACEQTIRDVFPDSTERVTLDDLPHEQFTTTLTLTRRTLRLGMIFDRGWSFWKKPSMNLDKSLQALRQISADEMRPSVDKLLTAFNEAQSERAAAGFARLQVAVRMFDSVIATRAARLKEDKAAMEQIARDPNFQSGFVHRLQSKMEVLERRLLNLSAIEGQLSDPALQIAA